MAVSQVGLEQYYESSIVKREINIIDQPYRLIR